MPPLELHARPVSSSPALARQSDRWSGLSEPDFGDLTEVVERVASALSASAAERDRQGGTAVAERQLLRDSGLLTLAVPRRLGGQEASWPLIMRIVRRFAQADSSMAHLFGFQHLQVASVLLFGSTVQQNRLLAGTLDERWFWGNAVNARDPRLTAESTPEGFVLNGTKSFCSGALGSDILNVSFSVGPEATDRRFAAVPTRRAGITVNNDWDNLGQRQTDSGSVTFDRVLVAHGEVLGPPGANSSPRATLRNLIGQLVLTEIYLGNTQGALSDAMSYVKSHAQPWPAAGVEQARDDALLQLRSGEFWTSQRAASALADQALSEFQRAWQRGDDLQWDERGDLAISIASARLQAARTALHVTAQIFELIGARGTARHYGFDRYWRNVRVHTLHDPLDYRQKGIGRWVLTGQPPDPHSYG